ERMKQKVNDELKKHFRPEFLNRIDEIVVFHQLTEEQIVEMVDLMVGRVRTALKTKDMDVEVTDKAKHLLAKRGFDPVLGARPLRRTIQREIEDQLSEKILFGEVAAGELVSVDVEGWDGESDKTEDARFTFSGSPRPEAELEEDREEVAASVAPAGEAGPGDSLPPSSGGFGGGSTGGGEGGPGAAAPAAGGGLGGGPPGRGPGGRGRGAPAHGRPAPGAEAAGAPPLVQGGGAAGLCGAGPWRARAPRPPPPAGPV